MSTLAVQVDPLDGVEQGAIVRLEGALDQPTRDGFLERLKAVLAEGKTRCVLDMRQVNYANSTAIGDLVNLFDSFRDAGGDLVLLSPQRRVNVIIEMVGLNSVLPILDTLDEARQHLSATPDQQGEEAPEAVPVPAETPAAAEALAAPTPAPTPAAPVTAAPAVAFPLHAQCIGCNIVLELAQPGRYRCPHCGTIYSVDATGRVGAARPRVGHPIELTVPCHPRALHAFQQFVAGLPAWDEYTDDERLRLESAMAEICDVIHQKAYEGAKEGTFHVLIVCRDDELALRVVDHGKTLERSAFPTASSYMSEFEHRAHPTRGNYLKMAKRPS